MRHRKYAPALLFTLVVLAFALTGGIVHAEHSRVKIVKKVMLSPDGTFARVTLKLRCPGGSVPLDRYVTIEQGGIKSESGLFGTNCDDRMNIIHVDVTAPPGAPFVKGKAEATAHVWVVDLELHSSTILDADRHVRLKRTP